MSDEGRQLIAQQDEEFARALQRDMEREQAIEAVDPLSSRTAADADVDADADVASCDDADVTSADDEPAPLSPRSLRLQRVGHLSKILELPTPRCASRTRAGVRCKNAVDMATSNSLCRVHARQQQRVTASL